MDTHERSTSAQHFDFDSPVGNENHPQIVGPQAQVFVGEEAFGDGVFSLQLPVVILGIDPFNIRKPRFNHPSTIVES